MDRVPFEVSFRQVLWERERAQLAVPPPEDRRGVYPVTLDPASRICQIPLYPHRANLTPVGHRIRQSSWWHRRSLARMARYAYDPMECNSLFRMPYRLLCVPSKGISPFFYVLTPEFL